jgi:small-conductance mechanosensitive channel
MIKELCIIIIIIIIIMRLNIFLYTTLRAFQITNLSGAIICFWVVVFLRWLKQRDTSCEPMDAVISF